MLGPSGSGKSTLLRMLVGLAEITAGELLLDGEPATDWAPAERDLGMVFQDYAPYPHLSVRDNIAFPLRLARTPEDDVRRRVEAIAAELELTEHLSRWPSQLSGGQRQRVALGRVLVRRPAGYLLDEPLSTQDPACGPVRRLLGLIARTGITTVYVTHDQGEAMALGGRVAVLWHGALQQVDTPEAVYERPANLVVASCVGSPAANLLPATVAGGSLRLPMVDVPLDASARDRLGGRDRVVAAVRPEHLVDAALVPGDGASPAWSSPPGSSRRTGPAPNWSPGCATATTARCRPPSPRCGRSCRPAARPGSWSPGWARAARPRGPAGGAGVAGPPADPALRRGHRRRPRLGRPTAPRRRLLSRVTDSPASDGPPSSDGGCRHSCGNRHSPVGAEAVARPAGSVSPARG